MFVVSLNGRLLAARCAVVGACEPQNYQHHTHSQYMHMHTHTHTHTQAASICIYNKMHVSCAVCVIVWFILHTFYNYISISEHVHLSKHQLDS